MFRAFRSPVFENAGKRGANVLFNASGGEIPSDAFSKTGLRKARNMKFEKLVPNVFYTNIAQGLRLWVDCLGFEISHDEIRTMRPFCVVHRDGLRVNLFQDSGLANEHNPEFRLVTEDIDEVYKKVSKSHPEFLHPNLKTVTLRPWGAKEFALTDKQIGIVIQEWPPRGD